MTPPRPPTPTRPSAPAVDLDDPVVARLGAAIDPPGRLSRAAAWPGAALRRAGDWGIESWLSLIIVAGCVVFIFTQLGPANVLSSSTPGGRRHGRPRVGPGLPPRPPAHVVPAHAAGPPTGTPGSPRSTSTWCCPSLAIALLSLVLPYGLAFKLVAISGLLSLPVACWAFAKLTRLPFPAPPLLRGGRHRLPVRPLVLDLRRQHRLDPGR